MSAYGLRSPVIYWLCTAIACLGLNLFALSPANAQEQAPLQQQEANCHDVVVFVKPGCPYCKQAHEFLEQRAQQIDSLAVKYLDVVNSVAAQQQFAQFNTAHNLHPPSVPTILVCDKTYVGFDSTIAELIDVQFGLGTDTLAGSDQTKHSLQLPVFGQVNLDTVGLISASIMIGLVDGFNPCAMWVLLFLLSILVNTRSRRKMILIAGTFVLVSGLVYFAFMAAWLNIYLIIGFSRALQIVIGLIAISIGLIHCKDFFAFKRGVSLSISDRVKPEIYRRSRAVVLASGSGAAILSVAVLALMVNVVELVCTAGLPAVYTQLLVARELSAAQYYGYLLIYNLAYIFDDSVMVAIAVITLNKTKLQKQHGRWLKLLSGSFILILGLLMLFAPQWLI